MPEFGSVTSVVERPVGTTLAVVASAGNSIITVDDISKLTWPAGGLRIGSEQFDYTIDAAPDQSVDTVDLDEDAEGTDELGTITLDGELASSYGIDEPVVQFQESVVSERIATVLLADQAEELVLRVPRHLWDRLPAKIRQRDAAPETVALEDSGGEWVMTDVVAEDPSLDASFINAATLPTTVGPRSATAGADAGSFTETWLNPGRVVASDNSWATAIGTSGTATTTSFTTGFKYPTTVSDDASVGAQNWDATGAALGAPDDVGASATAPSDLNTHYLVLTGFGFAVPTGATITGVQVTVIRRNASGTGSGATLGAVQDNLVKLVKAGSVVGSDQSNLVHWPVDFTGIAYGDASDLWGTTWTPAQINDADFGGAISADMNAEGEARIDAVRVRVNYTVTSSTSFRSNTHYLKASDFGFTIPDEAVVTGIQAEVERHASDNSGDDFVRDNQVRLTDGTSNSALRTGTSVTADGPGWDTTDALVTYGGDRWGTEWLPEIINDPAFGVLFSANVNFNVTAFVDRIRVTVSYVLAGDA